MPEDHEVAVGEPAQQRTGLGAGLPVELAGVVAQRVGEFAHERVQGGRVVDGVVDVGDDPLQILRQLVAFGR